MKAYTISGGVVSAGIRAKDGIITVGESGRGRSMVSVPVRDGSTVVDDMLVESPGAGALVLIRDHSGYRGGWQLTSARSAAEWDSIVDGAPAPERIPHRLTLIASGHCAQGDAGRMGGGPEYLLRMPLGSSAEVVRSGRLYGHPSVIRIDCDQDGSVTVTDPRAESETRAAARRMRQRGTPDSEIYAVRIVNGKPSCTCPGGHYRGKCKHADWSLAAKIF